MKEDILMRGVIHMILEIGVIILMNILMMIVIAKGVIIKSKAKGMKKKYMKISMSRQKHMQKNLQKPFQKKHLNLNQQKIENGNKLKGKKIMIMIMRTMTITMMIITKMRKMILTMKKKISIIKCIRKSKNLNPTEIKMNQRNNIRRIIKKEKIGRVKEKITTIKDKINTGIEK
jgi:hypothetical protein